MLPYFKNWRQFRRAWNKLWQEYVTKYPSILLQFDLKTDEEREVSLLILPLMWMDQEDLIKRLPPDLKHPDNRKIKRPTGRALVPWEHEITDISGPNALGGDDRFDSFQFYDNFFVEKYCQTCNNYKLDRSKYSQSVIDFLEKRDPSFIKKFKYRNFCSDECKKKARNQSRRKLKSIKICPYCKEEYEGYGRTCKKSWCKKRAYRKKTIISSDSSRPAISDTTQ